METNNISLHRIVQRAKDVLTFNTRTYDEIVRDPSATAEAAIVVATVAIASGLGRLFAGPGPLIGAVLALLIGWVVGAAIIYFVGTRITGESTTATSVERVMRIVGYASAPYVFSIFSGLWLIGWIFATIIFFWALVTMVLAIRASLNMTLGRAVITGVIAWIGTLIANGIIGVIFDIQPRFPI
jgi:hypothetical protein